MKRVFPILAAMWGCESSSVPLEAPAEPPTGAGSEPAGQALASNRVAPVDGGFSIELPVDLLVQPFASTIMATSADGAFRLFVEGRAGRLLEVLGQLKDELIGLGWAVTQEKHFETATLLTLSQGAGRTRLDRAVWLVETGAVAATPKTLICDAQARTHGIMRLGAPHRLVCQTLKSGG